MIYVMSGSQPLNFEIKNGTTAPASPKENTLWAKSDTAISSWDFSPVQPHRRSSNRNLIVYPYVNITHTEEGLTWTDNKNGTVEINGTTTGNAFFTLSGKGIANHEIYLEPGTYTFKGGENLTGNAYASIAISYDNWATETTRYHSKNTAQTFTLTKPALGRVWLVVESGTTATGTFKPQLEKASAATSFIMGTAEGQVWFKTGSPGEATINALKKNGIWLPVDGCKQYVNGVWTSKEAKVYQGGAWVDITNELYLITAGVGLASGYSITNVNGGSTVVNADKSISFKGASSANAYQYLSPGIDVTHYSTMHVRVKGSTVCSYGLGTASALSASVKGAQDNVEETLSLDVSKLSGTYYPAVFTNLYTDTVTTTVYDWWFE